MDSFPLYLQASISVVHQLDCIDTRSTIKTLFDLHYSALTAAAAAHSPNDASNSTRASTGRFLGCLSFGGC